MSYHASAGQVAEVLGRYSNLGATGVAVRSVWERALAEVRSEPWELLDVTTVTRVRRMTPEQIEALVVDYRSGVGSWRLARKYGVSDSTALARLRAAGVELDAMQTQEARRQHDAEGMRRLREKGWTLREIGEQFGVTRQTVATRLAGQ